MIIRAKAPLRIGLAGGGTDVSPYSDEFGGAILNATVSMFAYATIQPRKDETIVLTSIDHGVSYRYDATAELPLDGNLDLLKGVYNRVIKDFIHHPVAFELCTYVDAPAGSGLGTSSTLVVAILGAFAEWLRLPLGEYELAFLAYQIERQDLKMAGGKQDQYAAAFGGFNYIEFFADDRVIVNPLRIKPDVLNELEFNIVLYFTGTSRLSSKIIEVQSTNISEKREASVDAMHQLKEQSSLMKEVILKGQFDKIGEILNYSWECKKKTAAEVSNPVIDELYEAAMKAGATGGKISGAGGGGFMFFYCPNNARYKVIETLQKFGGEFRRYQFTTQGLLTWRC